MRTCPVEIKVWGGSQNGPKYVRFIGQTTAGMGWFGVGLGYPKLEKAKLTTGELLGMV